MKKVITLLLVFALVLSVSAAAFAADATGETAADEKNYFVPNLIPSDENKSANLTLTEWDERANELTADQQALIEEAEKQIPEQTPDKHRCDFLFYAEADEWEQVLEMVKHFPEDTVAKMFTTDEEWVELALTGDNNILTLTEECCAAIFVPVDEEVEATTSPVIVTPSPSAGFSPDAPKHSDDHTAELPDVKTSGINTYYNLILTEYSQRKTLRDDQCALFEEARKDVKNTTADGYTCQYLVHDTADAWPMDLQLVITNSSDITVKQFTTDEEWIDVKMTDDLVLHLEHEGVLAIYTK